MANPDAQRQLELLRLQAIGRRRAAEASAQKPYATPMSAATNVGSGLSEVAMDIAGAPVDFTNWLLTQISRDVGSGRYTGEGEPFMGSDWLKSRAGDVGRLVGSESGDPRKVVPRNTTERVARGIGQGAAAMVLPVGPATLAAKSWPAAAPAIEMLFGTKVAPLTMGTIGAVAGGAGELAAEYVPDPWKPAARMAGNIIGGGAAAVPVAAAKAVPAVARAVGELAAPLFTGQHERLAARQVQAGAESPHALPEMLDEGPFVPGSVPTLFQRTGDLGVGAMERAAETKTPTPFLTRRAEQNVARVGALEGLQPTGSPQELGAFLRDKLRQIDSATQTVSDQATAAAIARSTEVGGHRPPEEYGATLRGALRTQDLAARRREKALWDAVDPDGTLTLPVTPLKQAAQRIVADFAPTAKPAAGEESAILEVAAGLPDVTRLRDVTALRARINDALREELRTNGKTVVYGRLSAMRGALEDTIANAVENIAAREAAEETVQPLASRLQEEIDAWRQSRAGTAAAAGMGDLSGAGRGAAGPARPNAGVAGTTRPAARGPGDAAGAEGLPPDAGNLDPGAAGRLSAASAATRERKQTFGTGPVGTVLRPGRMSGSYRLEGDARVPEKFFHPGPSGYEDVQSFVQAVGDDQTALAMLRDYAVSTMRKSAVGADGIIDPKRFAAWRKQHADALRALPELDAAFQSPLAAAETAGRAAQARAEAIDTFQLGAVGKIIGAAGPDEVVAHIGGIFGGRDRVTALNNLARQAEQDPAAYAGLRKAIVEHMMNKFISNTEAGTSGQGLIRADQFQTFMKANKAALATVFNEEEIGLMGAIAADLQRANRSITSAKLPGRPSTAQDLLAAARASRVGRSTLGAIAQLAAIGAPAGVAYTQAGLTPLTLVAGAVGFVGARTAQGLRQAGLDNVDAIVNRMLLDPHFARLMLEKYPPSAVRDNPKLTNYLGRMAVALPIMAAEGYRTGETF